MIAPVDISDEKLASILDVHAPWRSLAVVPQLSAWHADDELALWQALEQEAGRKLDAPFYCVAWPGAQALALAITQGVLDVRGKRVVDIGCGSGVAAVAAALAGAREVIAADVDALAVRSAVLLGRRHGVELQPLVSDVLSCPELEVDVVLCGDLIYSATQRDRFARALALWDAQGRAVLVADSGRPFFDAGTLREVLVVDVEVPRGVEGAARRTARVYR